MIIDRCGHFHRRPFRHVLPAVMAFVALTVFGASGRQARAAEGFSPTGAMVEPRARVAASETSGLILIAGGSLYGGFCLPMNSAELYDPASGSFMPAASLHHTRCEAAAVTLADGRVLVVGGLGEGIGSAEIFDPISGSFELTGQLNVMRGVGFTVTLLTDGRVLVAGGDNFSGTTGTAEVFDPSTGFFSMVGPMTTPRSEHSATLLRDGRVLLAGGGAGLSCVPVALSAELFDPASGTFANTAGGPLQPVWGHAAALTSGGRVLLVGGDPSCGVAGSQTRTAQLFDQHSGLFEESAPMAMERGVGLAATRLPDGRVLVAGGMAGEQASASAEIYDPVVGEFGEPLPTVMARSSHAQVALPDGRVLLAGGETDPLQTTGAAEILDPPTAQVASLEALVDVVPETLNLKSHGRFVTLFIGLPGRNPSEIDPSSVRLSIEGLGSLPPVACSKAKGDHDADGTVDLMLKFSRADVIALAPVGESVSFLVEGALLDATPFAGADQVRVICPGKEGGGCGAGANKPHHPHH